MIENKHNYLIKIKDQILEIELGKKKKIHFLIDELKITRKYLELISCCDCILHLQETKSDFVTDEFFYSLAKIINENLTDHQINWVNTFVAVELIKYDNALDKDKGENNEGIGVCDNIDQNLDNLAEINNPEIKNALIEQVKHKLKIERIIS